MSTKKSERTGNFDFCADYCVFLCYLALQVNDDLLVKIASRRQNVTEINISDCRAVHDHGVSSLASQCPGLQKYTAYRCKQLGDISLCALATHCPLLVKVHVGNQDKLTDAALKKVWIQNRGRHTMGLIHLCAYTCSCPDRYKCKITVIFMIRGNEPVVFLPPCIC